MAEQCLVVEVRGKRVKSFIWHGQGDARYGIAPFSEKCTAEEIRLMLKRRFGFDKVTASEILNSIDGIGAIGPNGIEPLAPYDDPRLDYRQNSVKAGKDPKTPFLGEFGQKTPENIDSKWHVSAPWPIAKSGASGEAWLHCFTLSNDHATQRVTDGQLIIFGRWLGLTKSTIPTMLAELRANRRKGETSVELSREGWKWILRGGKKPVSDLVIREDYYWLEDEPIGAATKSGVSLVRRVLRNRGLKQKEIAAMLRAAA